jgi:hypothetical protein
MNLLKDLWSHIKEWSRLADERLDQGRYCSDRIVIWIISWMTGGAA